VSGIDTSPTWQSVLLGSWDSPLTSALPLHICSICLGAAGHAQHAQVQALWTVPAVHWAVHWTTWYAWECLCLARQLVI